MEEWYHIADTHLTLPYRIDGILRRHMDEGSLNKYATWDHMKLSDLGYADEQMHVNNGNLRAWLGVPTVCDMIVQARTRWLGSVGVPTQVGRRTGKWLAFDFVNDLEKAGIPLSGWMQIARKNNGSEWRDKVFHIARWYTPKNPKSGQEPPDRKKEKMRGAPHRHVKRTFVEHTKNQQEWFDKETFHVGVLKAEQELGGRDKLVSRILSDLQTKYGTTWMDLKEEDVVVDMTEDLEDTVRRQGEELQDLRTQLQRTSKLTVFTARDMGEAKAALQIAVFLTGLFREHLQGILQAYQTARDQARDGGGASSTGSARVEPLKVLLYNGMIKYLVEYAEKSFPAAVGKCQEIAGFLAGRDVLAIGNTNNPPQMDAPWVLIVTFSGSARGREMRALWDCEEIQAMAQKRGGLWPEFGIKPGSWRPSQLYSE
ncbi:unnamed protein product, partial [Symbiodinium sp. KB8]